MKLINFENGFWPCSDDFPRCLPEFRNSPVVNLACASPHSTIQIGSICRHRREEGVSAFDAMTHPCAIKESHCGAHVDYIKTKKHIT